LEDDRGSIGETRTPYKKPCYRKDDNAMRPSQAATSKGLALGIADTVSTCPRAANLIDEVVESGSIPRQIPK